MKKKFFLLLFAIIFVIGALFLATMSPAILAFAQNLPTKATFFKAIVTTKNLNVRQGPSLNSPITTVLRNGENVEVYGKVGDWFIIYHPGKNLVGMVYSQFIKTAGQGTGSTSTDSPSSQPQNIIPAPVPQAGTTKKAPPPAPPVANKPITGATAAPAPAQNNSVQSTAEENELFSYVNQARKTAGVGLLQFDSVLLKTARLKARDMVEKNYFSHQSPTYGSPFDMMRQYGITFKTAGENIAGNSSVKGAFDAWMRSEDHKKNILNGSYNYIGIGIEPSPVYGKILVQQFIGR